MNKITVLKSHISSKEFWELYDYASGKEVTLSKGTEYAIAQCVVNHSVEITDEEIEKESKKVFAKLGGGTPTDVYRIGFWDCFQYIKSRISNK